MGGVRTSYTWSNPLGTPCILQESFGSYGQYLPDDGADYCAPTALSMSLYYLSGNGFTQLAPRTFAGQDAEESVNFERAIAGLLETAGRGGTSGPGYNDGLATYMSMCGISSDNYTKTNYPHPTVRDFETVLTYNSGTPSEQIALTTMSVSWYNLSEDNAITVTGGHVVTPLVYIAGTDSDSSQLILNNPAPFSFGGTTAAEKECQQTVYLNPIPRDWTYQGKANLPWLVVSWYPETEDTSTHKPIAIVNSLAALLVDGSAAASQGFEPQTWTLSGDPITIDTNGATLNAIAPIEGEGSLIKMGLGTFCLEETMTTTGLHNVVEGTLESTCRGSTPFGTGSIHLMGTSSDGLNCGGTLRVSPTETSVYYVAKALGAQLRFGTGASIYLAGTLWCSVLIGGNNKNDPVSPRSEPNVVRSGRGTLELAVDDLSTFGNRKFVLIQGADSNLPNLIDGFLPPYIIATGGLQGTPGHYLGQFLTYTESDTPWLLAVAMVSSADTSINDIGESSPSTVYAIVSAHAQQITSGNTVTVAALSITDSALDCNSGIIAIGNNTTTGYGGLILSGATIRNGTIAFGPSEGLIWMGSESENLSASLSGTNGLTFFGPGRVNLTGASSDVQGEVNVNGGTMVIAIDGALGDSILVNEGASLLLEGTLSTPVYVSGTGTLTLDGGELAGELTTTLWASSSSAVGSTLAGCGTIAQTSALTVYGLIKAGRSLGFLTFQQELTIAEKSTFIWSLGEYKSGATPDGAWNAISLQKASTIGFPGEKLAIGLDFSLLDGDPDQSHHTFWHSRQVWVLFSYVDELISFAAQILDNHFTSGQFSIVNDPDNSLFGNGRAWNLVWEPNSSYERPR